MTLQSGLFPEHAAQSEQRHLAENLDAVALRSSRALGWGALLAPRRTLLGADVHPVVEIDTQAHAVRKQNDQPPMLDRDTLAMWEWPESGPVRAPEVVKIVGILSRGRSWRRALSGAARLRGFCSTAVLVDSLMGAEESECLLECKLRGVGLVQVGESAEIRVVEPAQQGRAPQAQRRTLDRWIEELLYRDLIENGAFG